MGGFFRVPILCPNRAHAIFGTSNGHRVLSTALFAQFVWSNRPFLHGQNQLVQTRVTLFDVPPFEYHLTLESNTHQEEIGR